MKSRLGDSVGKKKWQWGTSLLLKFVTPFSFFPHLCRWCWNTRTKNGTSFKLLKNLLVALFRTLLREARFIPKSISHRPETICSPRRCFPLTVLESSQWASKKFSRTWVGNWSHGGFMAATGLCSSQSFPKGTQPSLWHVAFQKL